MKTPPVKESNPDKRGCQRTVRDTKRLLTRNAREIFLAKKNKGTVRLIVQSYLLNVYGLLGKSDQKDSWQFQQSIYDTCLVDP